MADQRCPFCGKSNPSGASKCQYCQARLKPLVASSAEEPQDIDAIFSQSQEPEESVPDWLKDLRAPEPESASPAEREAGQEEEFLQDSGSEDASAEPEPEGELQDDMPDWLARIRERNTEEQPPVLEAVPEEEESGPSLEEYLAQQEAQQAEQGTQEAAPPPVTDWLEAIGRLQREQEVQSAAGEPEDVTPADQVSAESSPEAESTPVEMSEPDWLQQARSRQAEETPANEDQPVEPQQSESPEPSVAPAEDLTDWLEEIGLPPGSAVPAAKAASLNQVPPSQPVEPQAEEAVEDASAPDWLADGSGEPSGYPESLESPILPGSAAPVPEEPAAPFAPENEPDLSVPEWLLNLDAGGIEIPSDSTPAFILDESERDRLDGEPVEDAQVVPYTPPGPDGVPDWLAQVSSEDASMPAAGEGEQDGGAEGEETPVEAGKLPGWLEAMRPVETVTPAVPGEVSAGVEKAGPLAGLKGALSAEELVLPYSKPKLQSIRLQVSDAQQAHVDLLEQLLATEGEPKTVAKRPARRTNNVLRTLIFLILMLALLAPTALNTHFIASPSLPIEATGVRQAYLLVNSLAANDPVLLAFDYQPGVSGEMDVLANEVIGQMETRKAHLAAISTSTVGPLMAQRIIAKTNTGTTPFYHNYTNLGFIPGGTSGLAGLAAAPRQVAPYDMNGRAAWGIGPLASITTLADFRLVVVFTENPDTARAWIEQAGPALAAKKTPLMMVVSAQAEPLVRPYLESSPPQVSALIAGLRGGAQYQSLAQDIGSMSPVWDSFGLGLLAAAAMIFVGALVSLIIGLVSAGKRVEAEGKA